MRLTPIHPATTLHHTLYGFASHLKTRDRHLDSLFVKALSARARTRAEWFTKLELMLVSVDFSDQYHSPCIRPFDYMFFTPLYGVRNTGCPQINTKKIKINWPLKRFLHLKMLNSAPKWHKCLKSQMCDCLVEIAISETYFKFWPLKFRPTSTTRRDRMSPNYAEKQKNMSPK
jgi:hypothetical protein